MEYGNFSMEWNMEENFSMEWNILGMEWKKIASMEYRKIVFHSIPYHALTVGLSIVHKHSLLFDQRFHGRKAMQWHTGDLSQQYCE